MTDPTDVLRNMKALESRLSEQVRQVEETRELIQQIKAKLAAEDNERAVAPTREGPTTAAAKVALFRCLFRGREDVFPLLLDETCWFLAADFDGEGWREDTKAILETCREHDVPAALERCRSNRRPVKEEVQIYDYLDDSMPVFRRMFEKRMRGYRAMGYETDESCKAPLLFSISDDV